VNIPINLLRFGSETAPQRANQFHTSYVKVRMFTGDHLDTAVAVANEAGIGDNDTYKKSANAIELKEKFDDCCVMDHEGNLIVSDDVSLKEKFNKFMGPIKVIARCTPADKLFFVKLLQYNKAQCAVVGDSMADAAALKAATVGICMKSACDVAKMNADVILLENEFTHIRTALMWGRQLSRNMQRFLTFQLTINIVICFITVTGSIIGHPPLNIIQMLWVNLIMDILGAIALGTESWVDQRSDVADNKKKLTEMGVIDVEDNKNEQSKKLKDEDEALQMRVARKDPLVRPFMWQQILVQAAWQCFVITILMFFGGLMLFPAGQHPNLVSTPLRDDGMVGTNRLVLDTFIFHVFVLMNLFNSFNCRVISIAELNVFSSIFNNFTFIVVVLAEFCFQ